MFKSIIFCLCFINERCWLIIRLAFASISVVVSELQRDTSTDRGVQQPADEVAGLKSYTVRLPLSVTHTTLVESLSIPLIDPDW